MELSPAAGARSSVAVIVPQGASVAARGTRVRVTGAIALLVAVIYFGAAFFIFRGVAAGIPSVLDGTAVINGDELVPFFNPASQLIDQAAGKFNQLTNGYEFRVRYAFLTTWMRYYKVLPFAILLVIPGIAYAGYLAVSWFLAASFPALSPPLVYGAAAAPVAVVYLIMVYSKVTHFYTLILGFSMCLIAIVLVTYGLLFAEGHPYRYISAAAVVTLFNPAVHYLILFALYQTMTVGGLLLLESLRFLRSGWLQRTWRARHWGIWHLVRGLRPAAVRKLWRGRAAILNTTFMRAGLAMVLLGGLALLPYGLFVKFVALRGVPNLSETVPGDFYFITDASISYSHLLALDMAGIMDKWMTGDYLAREPRHANMAYTLTLLLPLLVPAIRRRVFDTLPRRQFLFVIYLSVFFTMWATLGYSEPGWLPTFHRTIAAISRLAYGAQSTVGDLVLTITSTIVQVLRFPHRFELVLFMLACVLMPIPLVLGIEWTQGYIRRSLRRWPWSGKALAFAVTPVFSLLFLGPLFSSWQYRDTFLSGDMMGFLRPYPVTPLKEVKEELLKHPPGKVVVLPPTETAKVIIDIAGNEHKFIDKFHIYYLDLPSFYYGLTGDSDNKFEFFLLLRALYYQQDWWVNIARDVGIRYLVINRELIANTVGGAEYLREIEKVILPELDQMPEYLAKIYENESYVVYEFTDLPQAARIPLFVDLDWGGFIKLLSANPDLTRYYDLRHLVVSDDLTGAIAGSPLGDELAASAAAGAAAGGEADLGSSMSTGEELALVTNDPHAAALDLYIKAHKDRFFGPAANIYAFSPDIIPSSYYLSPMFRLFQFFSDSKWNRLNLITPGLYGSIQGSFIGVPKATVFRIAAKVPDAGTYRVLLRGVATANKIEIKAKSLGLDQEVELRARPGYLDFFDKRAVFTAGREPLDVDAYTTEELERLIPGEIVAVNNQYQYFDLGTVAAKAGKHVFYFAKQDNNPLLVEGILLIPEEEYQQLALPPNVRLLDPADLCCAPLTEGVSK